MANEYTNSVDERNNKDYSFGASMDQANKLADFLRQKQQFAAQQAQQVQLAQQGHQAKQDEIRLQSNLDNEGVKQRIEEAETLRANHPDMGVGVSRDGVNLTYKPTNPYAGDMADARKERNRQSLINNMTNQYSKIVGTAPKRVQAMQAMVDALNAGDLTSIGRIKANLPVMEGENFKPTDAERELILHPTSAGKFAGLKNFVGMDSPEYSKAQGAAMTKFIQSKLPEEQALIGRGRHEVLTRFKGNVKALSPDQLDSVSNTLGMSNEELLNEVNGKVGSQQLPAPQQAPAPGTESPEQELARLKAKHQGR